MDQVWQSIDFIPLVKLDAITLLRDTVGLQQAVWLTVQTLEPCTNAQVKDALGERRAVTHQALRALVKQGKVVKAG